MHIQCASGVDTPLRSMRISAVSCIATDGVEDVYLIEGSVNGSGFMELVRHCLQHIFRPFIATRMLNQSSLWTMHLSIM